MDIYKINKKQNYKYEGKEGMSFPLNIIADITRFYTDNMDCIEKASLVYPVEINYNFSITNSIIVQILL
jgi:predicted transcriptional regulator